MTNLLTRLLKRAGRHTPSPGDYYTILYANKGIKIAKVLAVDIVGLHLRIYANEYAERPASVDPALLQLGFAPEDPEANGLGIFLEALSDGAFFGMGHMPVRTETFRSMEPVFMQEGEVNEEELEGFYEWENANGGYW